MQQLPQALAALGARAQFVTWFAQPSARPGAKPGKLDKFPCDWRTGDVIDSQNPEYWTNAETALLMASSYDRGHGFGAGFVFTRGDPFWFLDGDSMLLPDGSWSPLAHELTARLPGAACEISTSGTGLHWFGTCAQPFEHACRNKPMGLELYTEGRFVALTGIGAQGDAGTDLTAHVTLIGAQYFPPSPTGDFAGWTAEPVPEWGGPVDDDDLIRKAIASGQRNAARAFGGAGGKLTFEQLWTGDQEAIRAAWPEGQSEADMALANHLAFWTGKDCERMERLMRRSGLARDKWDTHRTYMGDTILKACAFVGEVARGAAAQEPLIPPPPPEVLQAAVVAGGRQLRPVNEYVSPMEQAAIFEGCWYLTALNKVFSLSRNALYDRPAFDVVFGGALYIIDPMGQKTVPSAWEAMTQSRVHTTPIAHNLCFRPELPPGEVVTEGHVSWVNSYVPYDCPAVPGDVTPWTDFLRRLLPVDRDREILVNYMARVAQSPGVKLQWWPVLQGTKGNGKTLLLDALCYITGDQYSHRPNAHSMARDGLKFNSWIDRKLFIGVEEIGVHDRRDFLEEFKIIVTNRRIPMEGKGTNQTNGDNRANGMLLTNQRGGVPIEKGERRYSIFYTAQQDEEDLARDGMDGEYFPRLYEWFRGGGAAIIAHHLKTYPIAADLDPAGALHRAPQTSSHAAALRASLGRAEQEILEAIEEGRHGFAGGWVSSKHLDTLIDSSRASVPRNKRRDMMRALGYDWHPALKDGRVNDVIEGGKPKLYVAAGHLSLNLTSGSAITAAYLKAQEPRGTAAAVAAFG